MFLVPLFRVPLFASPCSAFPFSRLPAQQKGRARPVWSRLPDNLQPVGGSFAKNAKKYCYTTWTRRPTRRLLLMVFRPLGVRIRARKPILRALFTFEILCG
jgi:hypothetical protein